MKKTFRRRRHTSNWLYAILAGSILLITLCIISLIPSAIDGEQQPEQSDSSGLAGTITPTPPSYITPAPAHIRITINPGKLSLLLNEISAESAPAQSHIPLQEQMQELALALEELTAEREELQHLYNETMQNLDAEKNDYLIQQKSLQTDLEDAKQLLENTNTALSEYSGQLQELTRTGESLAQEEIELQKTEEHLQLLHEDIVHAEALLSSERSELETEIQNIKNNPNLSATGKETALIPLYSALEQLLVREAGIEHSKADYTEQNEALLAQKENLASRLADHKAAQAEIDSLTEPLTKEQQEHKNSIQNLEARIHAITIELERLQTEKAAFDQEYRDKLAALEAESERLEQEKLTLQEQSESPALPSDTDTEQSDLEQSVLEQRTLERIFLFLQDISLTEDSNLSGDILLTDIADITITVPEPASEHSDVSRTSPDIKDYSDFGIR